MPSERSEPRDLFVMLVNEAHTRRLLAGEHAQPIDGISIPRRKYSNVQRVGKHFVARHGPLAHECTHRQDKSGFLSLATQSRKYRLMRL